MSEYNSFDHIGYSLFSGAIVVGLVHAVFGLAGWIPIAVSVLSPGGLALAAVFGKESDGDVTMYPVWGGVVGVALVAFGYAFFIIAPLLSRQYAFIVPRALAVFAVGMLFVAVVADASDRKELETDDETEDHTTDLDPGRIEVSE